MATDPGGSWGVVFDPYAPPERGPEFTLPRCGCVSFGDGPPANGTGSSGDIYVDDLTQTVYQNQNGTWVIILTSGSVAGQYIFSGNGDPTGVVVPTVTDAFYRQLDSVPAGLVWTWKSPGPWSAPIT